MKRYPFAFASVLCFTTFACAGASGDGDGESSDHDITLGSAATELPPLPEACTKADIVAFERPNVNANPSGGSFTYRARYRKPARPELPTVVHLPGGPGLPSIGEDPAWLSPKMGLVQTDPRGVGCNPANVADPASFYRSSELAEDVVAAIGKLGLTNYVIHGHSYGTVLATRVAHLLSERDLPKPKAVLLEGVLGRAFDREWVGESYVAQWELHMRDLPAEAREELAKDKPLGIDGKTWGNAFMALTSAFGATMTHDVLGKLANGADGAPDNAARSELKGIVNQLGAIQPTTGAGHTLQRFVACREITNDIPDDNIDVVLDHGKLVKSPDAGTLCEGLALGERFDVKDHLYPFRTYYFLGARDPATPTWQGKLHFDELKTAERVELVVGGSGHMILDTIGSCAPTLIEKAAEGAGFGEALANCAIDGETRFKHVGE
jgi:pimeloyl-ACP methyl ester carboxylesterase